MTNLCDQEKRKIILAGRLTVAAIALLATMQVFSAAWMSHQHHDVMTINQRVDENRDAIKKNGESIDRNGELLRQILDKLATLGR